MDEAFAGIDYGNQQRLLGCLRNLAANGIGIALTTHDPEQAVHLSTRAVLLAGGKIIADGPPEEVLTVESVWSLYGVRVDIVKLRTNRMVLCPRETADRVVRPISGAKIRAPGGDRRAKGRGEVPA